MGNYNLFLQIYNPEFLRLFPLLVTGRSLVPPLVLLYIDSYSQDALFVYKAYISIVLNEYIFCDCTYSLRGPG